MVKSLEDRVREISSKLKDQSVRCVFYVGAGCSASAGVPTFHGKNAAKSILHVREDQVDTVFPSFAHRAIKSIIEAGNADYVTTSNHDGLLHKTGLNHDLITEMFGCTYVEVCLSCNVKHRRSTATPPLNRKCEKCGGKLTKKGCRYGQAIETDKLAKGQEMAEGSDISISLGSGMHTWPFTLDGMCGKAPLRVVVTIGRTSADGFPGVDKYDMECDAFMQLLCQSLEIIVPPFVYEQKCTAYWKWDDVETKETISIGLLPHHNNEAVTFIDEELMMLWGKENANSKIIDRNTLRWTYQESSFPAPDGFTFTLQLQPKQEYGTLPPLSVHLKVDQSKESEEVAITFQTKAICDHEQQE